MVKSCERGSAAHKGHGGYCGRPVWGTGAAREFHLRSTVRQSERSLRRSHSSALEVQHRHCRSQTVSRAHVLKERTNQARLELPGSRQHGNELGHLAFFTGPASAGEESPLKEGSGQRMKDQSSCWLLPSRSACRLSVQWTYQAAAPHMAIRTQPRTIDAICCSVDMLLLRVLAV